MININIEKEFVIVECCTCGVNFAITKQLQDNLKKSKNSFFCPNGHSQSYVKSTEEILREEIEKQANTITDKIREIDEKDMEISRLERKIRRGGIKKK